MTRHSQTWIMWVLLVLGLLIANEGHASEPSDILQQTIALESSEEDTFGQYLVASVIMNRAKKLAKRDNLPMLDAMVEVCLAPKQFSAWNNPRQAESWLLKHYNQEVANRAGVALLSAIERPYAGITHYHTLDSSPYWAQGVKPAITHGNHHFYKGIK